MLRDSGARRTAATPRLSSLLRHVRLVPSGPLITSWSACFATCTFGGTAMLACCTAFRSTFAAPRSALIPGQLQGWACKDAQQGRWLVVSYVSVLRTLQRSMLLQARTFGVEQPRKQAQSKEERPMLHTQVVGRQRMASTWAGLWPYLAQ
jgi:hypothetical protein